MFSVYNCTPNPFINEDYVLYDFDRNYIKNFCVERIDLEIERNICQQKCPQNCYQSFNILIFQNFSNFKYKYSRDSVLKISNKQIKNIHYQAQISVDLIQCFTDIGGLFGLYIGLSLVDLGDIAKKMFTKGITFLEIFLSIYCLENLKIKSKKIIKKILIYLRFMKKVPLRYIINIITTPILLLQLFYLVNEYFQYPTVQDTEFPLFETNASINNKGRISAKEFPAISLCHRIDLHEAFFNTSIENLLDKAVDMTGYANKSFINHGEAMRRIKNSVMEAEKMYNLMMAMIPRKWTRINFLDYFYYIKEIIEIDSDQYPQKIHVPFLLEHLIKYIVANSLDEFEHNMEHIYDIDRYGLNGTLDMFKFFNIHTVVEAKSGFQWVRLQKKQLSLTPYGMCSTVTPGHELVNQFINQLSVSNIFQAEYIKLNLFLHTDDTLPVRQVKTFYLENALNMIIILRKYTLEKLPSPYDTHCQPYEEINQQECFTKCYLKIYFEQFKCIPSKSMYLTVELNQTNWRFCPKEYQDDIIEMEKQLKRLFIYLNSFFLIFQ